MPIEFQRIEKDGGVTNRAVASWSRGEGGFTASFIVRYRIGKGNFSEKIETTSTTLEIDKRLKPGRTLEVQVKAVGIRFGDSQPKKSDYAKATAIIPDLSKTISAQASQTTTNIVPNVRNLSVTPAEPSFAILKFKPPKNQRLNNLTAIIRHTTKTGSSATFAKSVKIAEVKASENKVIVPLANGTYLIKLRDDVTKKKSPEAVSVEVDIPDASARLEAFNLKEDTIINNFGVSA